MAKRQKTDVQRRVQVARIRRLATELNTRDYNSTSGYSYSDWRRGLSRSGQVNRAEEKYGKARPSDFIRTGDYSSVSTRSINANPRNRVNSRYLHSIPAVKTAAKAAGGAG